MISNNPPIFQPFESDDANFIQATWVADVPVLIRKDKYTDCFHINASHFCRSNTGTKKFANWSRNLNMKLQDSKKKW